MKLINCNNANNMFVRVENGDNLTDILSRYQVKPSSIIRNNNTIDLYEGEIIKIICKRATEHIVKPAETLQSIAKLYNKNVDELVQINNLSSSRVFVGQRIIIDIDK